MLSQPAILPHGSFQFTVSGVTGQICVVQASTNLLDWTPLTNFVSTNAVMYYRDPAATDSTRRFYRAVSP